MAAVKLIIGLLVALDSHYNYLASITLMQEKEKKRMQQEAERDEKFEKKKNWTEKAT